MQSWRRIHGIDGMRFPQKRRKCRYKRDPSSRAKILQDRLQLPPESRHLRSLEQTGDKHRCRSARIPRTASRPTAQARAPSKDDSAERILLSHTTVRPARSAGFPRRAPRADRLGAPRRKGVARRAGQDGLRAGRILRRTPHGPPARRRPGRGRQEALQPARRVGEGAERPRRRGGPHLGREPARVITATPGRRSPAADRFSVPILSISASFSSAPAEGSLDGLHPKLTATDPDRQ